MTIEQRVVGIRTPSGLLVKGFDVCIKGEDVYVNYSDSHTPAAHGSYHASGQKHTKIGRDYVKWDAGPSGNLEPMKLFRTPTRHVIDRSRCWTIGWEVPKLDSTLPKAVSADVVIPAQDLQPNEILGLEVSVVGKTGPITVRHRRIPNYRGPPVWTRCRRSVRGDRGVLDR